MTDSVTTTATERRKSFLMPTLLIALGSGMLGLIAGLVLGLVTIPAIASSVQALGPTPIDTAVDSCDVAGTEGIRVGDEGHSISLKSLGEESPGADYVDIVCVLVALDVPDSVVSRIESTRALDGRQTANWEGLAASWGYHPDDGLDMVISMAGK